MHVGKPAGFIWQSPITLIATLIALVMGARPHSFYSQEMAWFWVSPEGSLYQKWFDWRGFGAMTLGSLITFRHADQIDYFKVHECTHIRQGSIFGVLQPILYGGASLCAALNHEDLYMGNWFEKQAYRAGTLGRSLWLWE